MISGIGIDIVKSKRFDRHEDKYSPFLTKIFTDSELDYSFRKNTPSLSLAGKFAAKEAIVKIFTNKGINISHLKEIEILNDKNGLPFVNSFPLEIDTNKIKLSISHDGGFAIAIAMME